MNDKKKGTWFYVCKGFRVIEFVFGCLLLLFVFLWAAASQLWRRDRQPIRE